MARDLIQRNESDRDDVMEEKGRMTSMNTKYAIIDYNRQGQEVEHVGKIRPYM
jgi:hypothetical protein